MRVWLLLIAFVFTSIAQDPDGMSYPSFDILSDSSFTILNDVDTIKERTSVFAPKVPINVSNRMIVVSNESYNVFKNENIIDNRFDPCGIVTLIKTSTTTRQDSATAILDIIKASNGSYATTTSITKIRTVVVMTRYILDSPIQAPDNQSNDSHGGDGYTLGGVLCIVGGIALVVKGIIDFQGASEAENTLNTYTPSQYDSYGLGSQHDAVQSSIDGLRVRGTIFTCGGGVLTLCGIGFAAHK